jgi:hypothetical protein
VVVNPDTSVAYRTLVEGNKLFGYQVLESIQKEREYLYTATDISVEDALITLQIFSIHERKKVKLLKNVDTQILISKRLWEA